jgi:Holliday junction resolvasome RuvABC ATP-dependent DNA helicase subunit
MTRDFFKNMVGQTKAKRTMAHLIECYQYSRFLPTTLNIAPKGNGKTTLAVETARHLYKFDELGNVEINAETGRPRIKPLVKVNASSLTSVKSFINGLVIPMVQDKDVTVLIDEASEIPHKVSMAMLDIFNTPDVDTNYKTTFRKDEYFCEFDFRRQSFIFCTSESQKVFHALADRLKKVVLDEYSLEELGQIVQLKLPHVTFEDGVLEHIASVVRGNARSATNMAIDIRDYLKSSDVFMLDDWVELKDIFNITPLGLNPIEVQILRHLSMNSTGTSLFRLSAKTGMTREQLQKDSEMYLQKHDLMEITTTGRIITSKGLQYLKELEASQIKVPNQPDIIEPAHQIECDNYPVETTVTCEPVLV